MRSGSLPVPRRRLGAAMHGGRAPPPLALLHSQPLTATHLLSAFPLLKSTMMPCPPSPASPTRMGLARLARMEPSRRWRCTGGRGRASAQQHVFVKCFLCAASTHWHTHTQAHVANVAAMAATRPCLQSGFLPQRAVLPEAAGAGAIASPAGQLGPAGQHATPRGSAAAQHGGHPGPPGCWSVARGGHKGVGGQKEDLAKVSPPHGSWRLYTCTRLELVIWAVGGDQTDGTWGPPQSSRSSPIVPSPNAGQECAPLDTRG